MLRVGTILHGTYRVDGYLASGGFGNTYVATNIQFGERYAIKEFFLKGVTERDENTTTISVSNQENAATFEAQRDKFKKEAVRLRKLSSPHIVCVHDLFEENGTAYYVMDFVDGENLRDYLKKIGHPLDEATVWQVFDQVLDALEVVHSHGLFHLDLKPANLMMDQQGGVRLIDFGASKQMKAGSGATTSTAVSYTNGHARQHQRPAASDGPLADGHRPSQAPAVGSRYTQRPQPEGREQACRPCQGRGGRRRYNCAAQVGPRQGERRPRCQRRDGGCFLRQSFSSLRRFSHSLRRFFHYGQPLRGGRRD